MSNNVLALDVGDVRIGVAFASGIARLPRPLTTLAATDATQAIVDLVQREDIGHIVVGLPRNLSGDDTTQTKTVRAFADALATVVTVPITLQDEAGTSVKAESELRARNKPYAKGDIDALAATYILEDYINANYSGTAR